MVEEPFFAPEAAGIAYEVAFGADDAVTGDDDGDIVLTVCGGGGADGLGIAEAAGQFEIADGLPKGDGGELVPYPLLKGRAVLGDGEVEDAALPLKILDHLFDALDDQGSHRALEARVMIFSVVEMVYEADLVDIGICSPDTEKTKG